MCVQFVGGRAFKYIYIYIYKLWITYMKSVIAITPKKNMHQINWKKQMFEFYEILYSLMKGNKKPIFYTCA